MRDVRTHLVAFVAGGVAVFCATLCALNKLKGDRSCSTSVSQQVQPSDDYRRQESAPRPTTARTSFTAPHHFYAINPMKVVEERVVIAFVGLPARGKSYISKAVLRYASFLGCPAKLFNAGNKRRDGGKGGADAAFFDTGNAEAHALKEKIAMETLEELIEWLRLIPSGCAVGIFDATNTTAKRRAAVMERCSREQSPRIRLVFVESICDDESLLSSNYQMKLGNDDYHGKDADKSLRDFMERVRAYEKVYEPIRDEEAVAASARFGRPMCYVQTVNAGEKIVVVRCRNFIMSHILPLLQAVQLTLRTISIVIAGQSENDREGIRGGDSPLSERGLAYSQAVFALLRSRMQTGRPARVLTGTLRRYSQLTDMLVEAAAADALRGDPAPTAPVLQLKPLDELCFGSLEGLPGGKMRHSFPHEFAAREADKLRYRYPGAAGGSYLDMIRGMREVVLTIERARDDMIVVCDVAAARVLLGYFKGTPQADIPDLQVAPGFVELTRTDSGFAGAHFSVSDGRAGLLAT